jgi:segregation and condensation protein B
MDHDEVKPILESVVFASPSPVKLETLLEILPESNGEVILEQLRRIKEECEDPLKGFELVEVAGGYQFRTKPRWSEWVARLKKAKTVKFSQSALETLAIVAYRQPVIRPEIEEIRGVDSGWVLRSLLEKGLVKIVGRKDLPGRPIIYGTTKAFLELFNLNSLADLPTLKEIQPPATVEGAEMEEEAKVRLDDEGETEARVQDEAMRGDGPELEVQPERPISDELTEKERGTPAEAEPEVKGAEGPSAEVEEGKRINVKAEIEVLPFVGTPRLSAVEN